MSHYFAWQFIFTNISFANAHNCHGLPNERLEGIVIIHMCMKLQLWLKFTWNTFFFTFHLLRFAEEGAFCACGVVQLYTHALLSTDATERSRFPKNTLRQVKLCEKSTGIHFFKRLWRRQMSLYVFLFLDTFVSLTITLKRCEKIDVHVCCLLVFARLQR